MNCLILTVIFLLYKLPSNSKKFTSIVLEFLFIILLYLFNVKLIISGNLSKVNLFLDILEFLHISQVKLILFSHDKCVFKQFSVGSFGRLVAETYLTLLYL